MDKDKEAEIQEKLVAEEVVAEEVQEKEISEDIPVPKTAQPSIKVDTERVKFVESVKMFYRGEILQFQMGDVKTVSREMRDILLKRGAIELVPR